MIQDRAVVAMEYEQKTTPNVQSFRMVPFSTRRALGRAHLPPTKVF